MLTFPSTIRSSPAATWSSWGSFPNALPLLDRGPPAEASPLGYSALDSYGRSGSAAGLTALGNPSFQMPTNGEMAQLLAEALAQGVGRKDKDQAAKSGGPGVDLGQLAQLASLLPALGGAGAGGGQGAGQGGDPSAQERGARGAAPSRRAQRARRVQRPRIRTRDRPRTPRNARNPASRTDGPRSHNETGIPNGLRANAANGARVVRQMGFSGTIGGLGHRNGPSDHPHGNAIDVMTNRDTAMGNRVAEHFRQNHQQLGVKYVIYQQRIASPRTGWQWQRMNDRGSPTANHMDHPHISFY